MTDRSAFAVFLHQQAIEAVGPAIKPYLIDSPAGPHLQCVEVDSGGALFEMTLIGQNAEGQTVEVKLMLPVGMVKLVVSVKRDDEFGFQRRTEASANGTREAPPAS
ncbi:MAG: hypothetical protein LKM32_14020 [Chiayiivirga sp.]|jgi:hypothetical protein|uniref:hypothetical protein n=1 Tax=Chiayiivirga sp. TaxID=2041042 RepID=UPI0025BF50E8|nr:hypothetical protein [Chiayiivirga sp.]MCI1710021.1 hypothetical protein [Chiayiivirga sp.]MCI1730446.1 hypothetical protein [Chiayiivirga sp.]